MIRRLRLVACLEPLPALVERRDLVGQLLAAGRQALEFLAARGVAVQRRVAERLVKTEKDL